MRKQLALKSKHHTHLTGYTIPMKHKITQYSADEIELTIEEVSTQLNQADFTVTATEGKAKEWLLSYDDKEYGHLSLVTEKDNEFTA